MKPNQAEKFRYLLESGGLVQKSVWDLLLKWFTPLVLKDDYETSDASASSTLPVQVGFTPEEILDTIEPKYFIFIFSLVSILTKKTNYLIDGFLVLLLQIKQKKF